MRLWHTKFLSVLPKQQLVAQWRELSSIAGAIKKNGTPNHLLVNFVLDYDYDHFISYAYFVRKEMIKRGYKTSQAVMDKIISLKPDYILYSDIKDVYKTKMDFEYDEICYYNLKEKYLCGGLTFEEFAAIDKVHWTL